MRVMLDTNVLISIFVFKSKGLEKILQFICERHELILSSSIIDELFEVVEQKFTTKLASLDEFLMTIPYKIEHTRRIIHKADFHIRDVDDEKILESAISSDIDILVTGDKDFFDIEIDKPEIMTPAQFLKYMNLLT